VALGKADAGLGLISGLSIALVAMISDRIIQARYRSEIATLAGN
jgi:glycine betaine/proline transport system permease protein